MRAPIALLLLALLGGSLGAQTPAAKAAPVTAVPAAAADSVVRPGMTAAQVRGAWGAPSGSRTRGAYSYLFFANRCQPGCGIQDVVILEGGQVVDAIARAPEHRYAGVSSSPTGRAPAPTPTTPTGSSSR